MTLLETAMQNPVLLMAVATQFLLGFALGYLAVKVAKYIMSFIAILILGMVLNVWSLGLTTEDLIQILGEEAVKIKDTVMSLLQVLGLLTVGPPSVGFILGLVVAMIRH